MYIEIGFSSSFIKKIKLNEIYDKNTIIFFRNHNLEHKFTYFFNENILTVIRIDKKEGWNYYHSGYIYDLSKTVEYEIGKSSDNTKSIQLNGFFPESCNLLLKSNSYNDEFSFKMENNNIIVTRIDKTEGWGHPHKCIIVKNTFLEITSDPDNFVNIGSSDSNEKKIIVNKNYSNNSILFLKSHTSGIKFTYSFNGNELLIKRIDNNGGWESLHEGFIYENNPQFEYEIRDSFSNTKILSLPGYFPESCELILKKNSHADNFSFILNNDNIIITRLDKNEGWGHHHSCVVNKKVSV